MGTPAYLAPEQIEGGSIDGRTDVYSLGCLLYECLSGETPFAHRSRLAVAWAHLEEEPPSASKRRAELPVAIDAVIRRAMAKAPEDRYPTCTALITAAEEALGVPRPPAVRRLWAAAAVAIVLILGAVVVAVLVRGTGTGAAAGPAVKADTLVRINPATNTISAVVDVGGRPSATAVGGGSVWVYDNARPSVSEIDAATATVRHTTMLVAAPSRTPDAFAGPVLAADAAGAWLVGVDARGRSYLTRVFSGVRGKREYRLQDEPWAVAVGYDAVWVVVHGAHDNRVLRIDPATGEITKQTHFPASAPIDGLAAGLGGIWVVASSTGTLYRINPRSADLTGHIDLGERAARPEVVLGAIWVGLSDSGGDTVIVDPRMVDVDAHLGCCPPARGYDTVGHGAIWTYDTPTGTVERWNGQTYQGTINIHVVDPPFYGGLCLTSIAFGADVVWVTVAGNLNYGC